MVGFVASQTILTSCIIVVAFVFQCESNAEGGSHSFRHQHGQPKKYDESERGNDTDFAKSLKIPDLIVKPKEEIYLNCFLPQTTLEKIGYAVRWLHNGLIVDTVDIGSTSNGYRYSRDPTSGQLYISSVRMEDDGLWHCQYQDHKQEHSIASRPLKLVVLDKPRVPYFLIDGRRLDPGNLFIPVKESLELKMTCVVEGGNPRPRIKWMLILSENLDPTLIGEDTVSVALNVTDNYRSDMLNNRVNSHEQTRSEARLVRIQRVHHNATVVCIVQHVTLKTTLNASLLLDVQYTPSFAISREPGFGFPLREGMSVSLKCEVDSNPPSLPIWVKDDGSPLSSSSIDGFLNFTSIKKDHSGWYKCICHHLLGEFSSIGYFLNVRNDYTLNRTLDPTFGSYPTGRQVEVPLGGTIQIQCPEEAMGCWSRVGVNGRLEPVGPGPSLVMSNILYQDAGEYRCVSSRRAELDRWRSEVNVDVTVKGRPVVYPPQTTVTAYTGQELEFSVEFCANPPVSKAFWVTETQLLVPGRVSDGYVPHNFTVGSSIHCQEAVLTLRRVRMRDVGEIMFVARSSVGVAQGTIVLNVTPAAGYSSSSRPVPGFCVLLVFFLIRGLRVPPATGNDGSA